MNHPANFPAGMSLLSTRYRIEHTLGQGGMGTISRAYDRLTGTQVALKQLTLALEGAEGEAEQALRWELAAEFRLLATLRHPNIVSVLDYGFLGTVAFYTMELFATATPLTVAAQGLPWTHHVERLAQLLQALEYLRRHQVVHRDLKPDNVLVQAGQVKVLDFGLAALEGHSRPTSGSLFYMAPEAFSAGQVATATHATDLFAVGVMAYELLTGTRPFTANRLDQIIAQICQSEPDYARLPGPAALQAVVARLLAKDPKARFATAGEALAALVNASGQTIPLETHAVRASFIQAAQFVGRTAEQEQLAQALTRMLAGQGSAWLIGGESGVGKSRLGDELRIQALVQGALVWSGQALDTGGQPAQLWRTVLRWLALLANPDDFEASVLKPFVPDLATLLERPVPDAPALEDASAQTRFFTTVLTLLRRVAPQPLVLLLDDLQWVGPLSLALLTWVVRVAPELRLLVVGNYRDDEAPTLPSAVPGAQVISLKRLAPAQVTELISAILGQSAATLPHLTTFLYQQTEGNAFFLVEVLRTLAEEAGLLSQVTQMVLPAQVLAEGIQQVVQRRLQRLTVADLALLELAALDGRMLDLPLLRHLAPNLEQTAWLNRCTEAAVLEPVGAAWRFAHDQLRQGVLAALQAPLALHQQLAEGIEHLYAPTLAEHLGRLVHHYAQTPLIAKQRHYLQLAARAERAAFDSVAALGYYNQLAPLLTDTAEQIDLHLERGAVLELLGQWPEAETDYRAAFDLSVTLNFSVALNSSASLDSSAARAQAQSQHALGVLCRRRGDFANALAWLTQAQAGWTALGDEAGLGRTLVELGWVHNQKGDYGPAAEHAQAGLALAQATADAGAAAGALHALGTVAWHQSDHATAKNYFTESLARQRQLGDKLGIAQTLYYLGLLAMSQGDYMTAQTLYAESLALQRELGNKQGVAVALSNLGLVALAQHDHTTAQKLQEESLALQQALGDQNNLAVSWRFLGDVALAREDYVAAQKFYRTSLALTQALGLQRQSIYGCWGLAAAVGLMARSTMQAQCAIKLASATENIVARRKPPTYPFLVQLYARGPAAARQLLDETTLAHAWAEGAQMTLEALVAYALADSA